MDQELSDLLDKLKRVLLECIFFLIKAKFSLIFGLFIARKIDAYISLCYRFLKSI